MALKVKGPNCMVGTLDMGTASNGPRAIPAALQVTNAASHEQHISCMLRHLFLQTTTMGVQSRLKAATLALEVSRHKKGSKSRGAGLDYKQED